MSESWKWDKFFILNAHLISYICFLPKKTHRFAVPYSFSIIHIWRMANICFKFQCQTYYRKAIKSLPLRTTYGHCRCFENLTLVLSRLTDCCQNVKFESKVLGTVVCEKLWMSVKSSGREKKIEINISFLELTNKYHSSSEHVIVDSSYLN